MDADVEAGSVHLKAGHFDDPSDRAGLAHFHEHMLFLGTDKYPSEEEYEGYLSMHGGSSNAYTDMEDTNYYFSISPYDPDRKDDKVSEGLMGALDRLAEFFKTPSFNESAVERELRAIDSEYVNGISSDNWKEFQLMKSSADPLHPFSKFGCGNYETLSHGNGRSPREDLLMFWDKFYHAENAKLCVVGKASLEALADAVESTFGKIRPSSLAWNEHLMEEEDVIAFPSSRLGVIREVIPLQITRKIKISFAMPPTTDAILATSRPHLLASHLLGHEAPNTLHAVLSDKGLINGLSSGTSIDTSTFSFFSVTLSLTPHGMQNKDQVLDLVFQWLNLIKNAPHDKLKEYHQELQKMADIRFNFREAADPLDFASYAAKQMFRYPLEEILSAPSSLGEFDSESYEFLKGKLVPENAIITVFDPDHDDNGGKLSVSDEEWETEKWYKARYRQKTIPSDVVESWSTASLSDAMELPPANPFIPSDFSLRCEEADTSTELKTKNPIVIKQTPSIRLWHKMDQTWKVPKSTIRILLTTPVPYESPRSMTLCRLFQRVLNDDLNSYVYDAIISGCNYRVSCIPSGFELSFSGYNEKVPFLLKVVSNRIKDLVEQMKEGPEKHPDLHQKFSKALYNLSRETKNYKLDAPYELNNYNSRILMEEKAWHVDAYIKEMEGELADKFPLSMEECGAKMQEAMLNGRNYMECLVMGNVDKKEAEGVEEIINDVFLEGSRPLLDEELPGFKSFKLPTKDEARALFDTDELVKDDIPIIHQELAFNSEEENNAVELILQAGCDASLKYKGVAILELIGYLAYNSAYTQLRTKEQLGYIVSAFVRKTSGGARSLSVVVQSSSTLPDVLEERVENWLIEFRKELEEMPEERLEREANAVVAQLLERDVRLGEEIGRAWGEITSTATLYKKNKQPEFDRIEHLISELEVIPDSSCTDTENKQKTVTQLKAEMLEFFDKHLEAKSPQRRAMSARLYSQKHKDEMEKHEGPGLLTSYDDVMHLKQYLETWPLAPYWKSYTD